MSLITNTFNAVSTFYGGIFSTALTAVRRNTWRNYFTDRKAPVMVDMNNLLEVYQTCPHLQIVINKKAEMLSNGIYKVRKKSGDKEDLPDHWSVKLMKNPNPMQPQKEFVYEYQIYYDIYANAFAYRSKPLTNSKPRILWNLPPALMKVMPTGVWLDQPDLSGIIDKYVMMTSPNREFTTDQVLHLNTGVSQDLLVSDSKMIALQLPISNIIGALKTRNLFIYFGPKMLVSSKGSDTDGALPLGEPEKKRVEDKFNRKDYGIHDWQQHTVVTTATLTVNKMSYPTKDMMLFEEIEDDFAAICGAYGMDRDLFPSLKGATNENKREGEKATYQTTIATAANALANFLDTLLGLDAENVECYFDYSHLAVMQEDKKEAAEEKKINIEAWAILFDKGIISDQHFADLADVEMDGEPAQKNDSLGKIPLALQQLALARERANTAMDTAQSDAIGKAIDELTKRLVESVIKVPTT